MATTLTGEKIANWQRICDAVEPDLNNFPEVQEHHADLTSLIEEGEALQVEQIDLMSRLRIVNQRRNEVADAGEQLRMRIAAVVQARYGFRSKKLISFGVTPRQFTRRTTPEEPGPEAPAPLEAQSENQ